MTDDPLDFFTNKGRNVPRISSRRSISCRVWGFPAPRTFRAMVYFRLIAIALLLQAWPVWIARPVVGQNECDYWRHYQEKKEIRCEASVADVSINLLFFVPSRDASIGSGWYIEWQMPASHIYRMRYQMRLSVIKDGSVISVIQFNSSEILLYKKKKDIQKSCIKTDDRNVKSFSLLYFCIIYLLYNSPFYYHVIWFCYIINGFNATVITFYYDKITKAAIYRNGTL